MCIRDSIKQFDKVITKLDENVMQLEKQKVSGNENSTKNEVLTNNASNSDKPVSYTHLHVWIFGRFLWEVPYFQL